MFRKSSKSSPRLKKTSRGKSERPKGLRLQTRDIELLTTLGEVSLLDSLTLHSRFFPKDKSLRSCRRRLQLYEAHGLTQQLFVRLGSSHQKGRLPTIHRLTNFGATVVENESGYRPPRTAGSNPPKSSHTLMHRLGMAKAQLAVNDACVLQKLPKPAWILEYDPIPGARLNAPLSQRFILRHDFFANGRTFACWPDAACLLSIPNGRRYAQLAVFWEYDRSTEGHIQIADKMPGYEAFLATHTYRTLWPNAVGVRIFFVVQSEQRLRNVIDTIRKSPAAKLVRLATVSDLTPKRLLTQPIWRTTDEHSRVILRP